MTESELDATIRYLHAQKKSYEQIAGMLCISDRRVKKVINPAGYAHDMANKRAKAKLARSVLPDAARKIWYFCEGCEDYHGYRVKVYIDPCPACAARRLRPSINTRSRPCPT